MLWDILMKLFMSLNKSSIHPSLNYLSKMNAPCISFHRSAFRAALEEGLWNNYAVDKEGHDADVCFYVHFSKIPATSDPRVG